jgi:hypothetical protein
MERIGQFEKRRGLGKSKGKDGGMVDVGIRERERMGN